MPKAVRKANPIVQKSDSWDAQCVGSVLIDQLETLPDANPIDQYWIIAQLVTTRKAISNEHTKLMHQLHTQLSHHYPSYRKFFTEIDGKTALAFFEQFPAPHHLAGLTVLELRQFLLKPSNYACSMKSAEKILTLVQEDGCTLRQYQEDRDFIIQSQIRQLRNCKQELDSIEERLERLMKSTGYRLETMYGIDLVTAASFIAEIGNIHRFSNAGKLARFAGIAPIIDGSGDNHKHKKCQQGNRVLHELFYRLASRQMQLKRGSKEPNQPYYHDFYHKKLAAGKTKKQAIICIMRKLVDVIYSLMKNKTEYVKPVMLEQQAG